MSIRIDVRADFSQVTRRLSELQRDLADKVIARTLNRVGDAVKTTAVREIARTYNLKQATVRQRISVRRAFRGGDLSVVISVQSRFGKRALNLISFGARQLARGGVSVQIRRDKPRFAGGGKWFIIANPRGGTFVARRDGPARGDIEPVRTVDVGQMFMSRDLNESMRRTIADRFAREFEQQFRFATR